jgi:hypothetical protein
MTKVVVICYHCKKTSVIQMTPEAMASWFASGKKIAPEWTDATIWEVLKRSAVCPNCAKEHPPGEGSHKIGCSCGECSTK